jgi:hypothetical protein
MNRSLLGLAATAVLTMTVQTGFAAKPVQVAAIPQSAASADLIARADRALRDYVAACSTGDLEAFARIVTSDANVVFVHYTTPSDVRSTAQLPDSEHLALLEMRGDRIFKMRSLGANAGILSTIEASVVTRATASSRASAQD